MTKTTKKATRRNEITPKRDVVAHTPKNRPPRRPLSTSFKLMVPEGIKEEGFDYRFILNRPDRIHQYAAAWWEPVLDGDGKKIIKPTGNDELILYRIESKFMEEDRETNREKTISLLREKAQLNETSDWRTREYIPDGHQAVLTIKK